MGKKDCERASVQKMGRMGENFAFMRRNITRFVSLLLYACLLIPSFGKKAAAFSLDEAEGEAESYFDRILENVKAEPLSEVVIGNETASFTYDENRRRTSYRFRDVVREFTYRDGVLFSQTDADGTLCFAASGDGIRLTVNGVPYLLLADESGSIVGILDENGNRICTYTYEGAVPAVWILSEKAEDRLAAQKNPFRYWGWYYDVETGLYYMGDGIFYDPVYSVYVQNDYIYTAKSRSGEPAIVQTITDAYVGILNSPSYGAKEYASPTEAQWKSGKRWYDSLTSQIELVARCIYAENLLLERKNDRKAIGIVILNRINQGFPVQGGGTVTAYKLVKYPAAFATINPNTYSKADAETTNARMRIIIKGNGDETELSEEEKKIREDMLQRFKEATLIACTLYYSSDVNIYKMVVGIPAYATNQTHFVGLDRAYPAKKFTVKNGQWYYGGEKIYNVCIPGSAMLEMVDGSGSNSMQYYYNKHYNIFFSYSK